MDPWGSHAIGQPPSDPAFVANNFESDTIFSSLDGITLELHTARRGPDYLARGRPDRLHDKGIGVADNGLVVLSLSLLVSFADSNEADYLPICCIYIF